MTIDPAAQTAADSPNRPPVHLARGYNLGERAVAIVLGVVGAVAILIAFLWPVRSVEAGPGTCLLRTFVGIPCPGCGMTRSWVHLAHGDVTTAFFYNPFGIVFMAVAAIAAVYVAVALIRRRPPEGMLDLVRPTPAVILVTTWLTWSAYRIWSVGVGQETWSLVMG